MKGLGAGIKVGVMTAIVAVLGFWMWQNIGERASGDGGTTLWAYFRDASGLASKSRVVVAGLTIGEITDRKLEGRLARITVKIRRGTEIWSNAIIFKKSSSLLGEFYLEIDPGTPESVAADGTIVKNRLLEPGEEIKQVMEATTTDQVLRSVSETLPRVDKALDEITGLVQDARVIVKNQITSIADNLDKAIEEDAILVNSILRKADAALSNIQLIVSDVRKATAGADQKIDKILDNADALLVDARREINAVGGSVREKLDRLDKTLTAVEETFASSASVAKKIDEDQGTLGRLVNDPTIADNISDITTDAKNFTSSLFNLQTVVGMRGEYGALSRQYRAYVGVEVHTRPDKFYLVEVVADPKGDIDETLELTGTGGEGGVFTRSVSVSYGYRFSFQFGRRFDWIGLRLGLKESTGGLGIDFHAMGDDLLASLDVYDFTYNEVPRVKLYVAYKFFRYLYVNAGVDDVIDAVIYDHADPIPIDGDSIDAPGQYTTWHQGKDVFFGVGLKFNDADLSSLLFIGGSALSGITSQ